MARFPRPDLAKQLADAMLGQSLFGDAHNGLFLAAPRRTGKSTFLQGDLVPELEASAGVRNTSAISMLLPPLLELVHCQGL